MKYYKIFLSNRQEVVIDLADYEKLVIGMTSGSFIKLKKAIVNPSFIQCVLPIEQQEALADETPGPKLEGYIDEATKSFVVTTPPNPVPTNLTDAFTIPTR